jgi:uncharacterized protein YbjQ (UPF0145 family)
MDSSCKLNDRVYYEYGHCSIRTKRRLKMLIVTTNDVSGKEVKKVIGLAKGSTIRARHLGKDIMAGFRGMVGGEISEYTKMMAEAREEALQRMTKNAEKEGANAVLNMRFGTSMVMQNASEVIAYGTAAVVE